MKRTVMATLAIAVMSTVAFSGGVVLAQNGMKEPGYCKAKCMKSDKRLMKMGCMLNLSEEQKAKIAPVLEQESVKVKAVREDSSLTREQRRQKMRDIHTATYTQIKPMLTPEQQKKHEEMLKSHQGRHHKHGAMTAADRLERMSKLLVLTQEQKAKIKPIIEENTEKMKALRGDTSLNKEQKREKMREMKLATFDKIKPILTPEQLKKHEEMMKCRHSGMEYQKK